MFTRTAQKQPATSLKTTLKDRSGAGCLRIGEMLRKQGHITAQQYEEAIASHRREGGLLSTTFVRLGFIDHDTIVNFLYRQHHFPVADLGKEIADPMALRALPFVLAKKYHAFPVRLKNGVLHVAMAEPTDTDAVERLRQDLGRPLSLHVASVPDIIAAYRRHYGAGEEECCAMLGEVEEKNLRSEPEALSAVDIGSLASEAMAGISMDMTKGGAAPDLTSAAAEAPIIKLVNAILTQAVYDGVSDIHIEPGEKSLQVRYRLDGALQRTMNLPVGIRSALASRIKVLATLNVTERRLPQDGRIKMRVDSRRTVEFRVSTLPTLFGERVVLRLLDPGSLKADLRVLGFETETLQTLERCINQPQGLLFVTGPTGSGKTVTLYSILQELNREDSNILTIEDPVEFSLPGVSQVSVQPEVGLSFAATLRAFLRQDPDVIMVGEVRDRETAEIATKAAMTGHMVLSTLHTNDSPSAVTRLVDIGIPRYMVSASLSMVLAQRLGRRLCPECRIRMDQATIGREKLLSMGFRREELAGLTLFGPKGCPRCNGIGYRGRVGFFELLEMTEGLAAAVGRGVGEEELRTLAIEDGMKTLRMAALQKARMGMTSIDEVVRRTVLVRGEREESRRRSAQAVAGQMSPAVDVAEFFAGIIRQMRQEGPQGFESFPLSVPGGPMREKGRPALVGNLSHATEN